MLTRAKFFKVFRQKIERAVNFYLFANPAETGYLSVQDGQLSNAVQFVEFRPRKVAVHTCLRWSHKTSRAEKRTAFKTTIADKRTKYKTSSADKRTHYETSIADK